MQKICRLFFSLFAGVLLISTFNICAADTPSVIEYEDVDAASYSCRDIKGTSATEVIFVKYVTKAGQSEYWVRIHCIPSGWKLLPYMSVNADGKVWDLIAIKNPDEKYIWAGKTLFSDNTIATFYAGSMRYFILSEEQVRALSVAKDSYLITNLNHGINRKFYIRKNIKEKLKTMLEFTYADFEKEWTPKDFKNEGP